MCAQFIQIKLFKPIVDEEKREQITTLASHFVNFVLIAEEEENIFDVIKPNLGIESIIELDSKTDKKQKKPAAKKRRARKTTIEELPMLSLLRYGSMKKGEKNKYIGNLMVRIFGKGGKNSSDEIIFKDYQSSFSDEEIEFIDKLISYKNGSLLNKKGEPIKALGSLKPAIRDAIEENDDIETFIEVYTKFMDAKFEIVPKETKKKSKKGNTESKKFSNVKHANRDKISEFQINPEPLPSKGAGLEIEKTLNSVFGESDEEDIFDIKERNDDEEEDDDEVKFEKED